MTGEARPLRIVSNVPGFEGFCAQRGKVNHRAIPAGAGAATAWRLLLLSLRYDVILIDGNEPYLWLLCLLRWFWPFSTCRLISVDIMFVKPVGWKQRFLARLRRLLLKRVDHFVHYFKDLEAYQRYFGISPERSSYVPFKVNAWERVPALCELSADGDYVFTGGRSLRDHPTFLSAMRLLPYPGIILYHDASRVCENGTALPLGDLPGNVRAVEDDGSMDSWFAHLRRAKIVVVTVQPDGIRAIGVSMYLNAMALKKCVIVTGGPGTNQVLKDEAILVPSGDPRALAEAIRTTWEDVVLRERTAAKGRAYAERVGGEERLCSDLLEVCLRTAHYPARSLSYALSRRT